MGPHHNIRHAAFQILHRLFHLRTSAEPAHHLLALLHRLKRCSDGNLRLAITHIPADEPVHNLLALHVPLRGLNRKRLIFRLLKWKQLLELPLPYRIRPVYETFRLLPDRIKLHQLFGNLIDCASDTALRFFPFLPVQTVNLRPFRLRPGVFLDCLQLRGKDIQRAAFVILNLHVVFRRFLDFNLLNAPVNPYAVLLMHDIVPNAQIRKALNLLTLIYPALFLALLLTAKNIAL